MRISDFDCKEAQGSLKIISASLSQLQNLPHPFKGSWSDAIASYKCFRSPRPKQVAEIEDEAEEETTEEEEVQLLRPGQESNNGDGPAEEEAEEEEQEEEEVQLPRPGQGSNNGDPLAEEEAEEEEEFQRKV